MATRTTSKPIATPPPSEAQARTSLAEYIEAHLQIEALETAAKQEIEAIKTRVADETRALKDAKALRETTLMRYAEAHPELFQKRQKSELYGGHKIGWQISPPAVVLTRPTGAKKKQTWDGFLESCRIIGGLALDFIRSKPEPDKEAILHAHRTAAEQARETGDPAHLQEITEQLQRLGVEVSQEERFVIDLNLQPETAAQAA